MQYFYSVDGASQQGPLDRDRLWAAGVRADTMVWREGLGDWLPAGQLQELSDIFAAAAQTPGPAGVPQSIYTQPTYATPTPLPGTSGMAVASLVLGILGIVPCCSLLIPSILAIIFGHIAKSEIRRSNKAGDGLATAGLVMGYLGLLIGLGLIVASVFNGRYQTTGATTIRTSPAWSTPGAVPTPANPRTR